jgi:hypothetical protein
VIQLKQIIKSRGGLVEELIVSNMGLLVVYSSIFIDLQYMCFLTYEIA